MVETVWLHIGTAKSGTSSLQKYLNEQAKSLSAQGLAYLAPVGKSSANDLAIALNRGRNDVVAELSDALNRAIETRPEPIAVISSEMFYGLSPDTILKCLPGLRNCRVNVLVYLRRQDRYIEAKFLQKAKNARFSGDIAQFIEKFDGSGSDYAAMLAPWQGRARMTLVPRVLERAGLVGGDVVTDALHQIGMPGLEIERRPDVNVSPGLHRVQLLQAAAAAGLVPPRRLQRLLAARFPQNPEDRGPILSQAGRIAFLSRFTEGNEALRARYYPDAPQLFDTSDLDNPVQQAGIPPFTDAQIAEITRLLQTIKALL